MAYIGSKPANKIVTASDIEDGVISTSKINYPLANFSADGGTVKLDGPFPTGTQNTALGLL